MFQCKNVETWKLQSGSQYKNKNFDRNCEQHCKQTLKQNWNCGSPIWAVLINWLSKIDYILSATNVCAINVRPGESLNIVHLVLVWKKQTLPYERMRMRFEACSSNWNKGKWKWAAFPKERLQRCSIWNTCVVCNAKVFAQMNVH